MILCKKKSSSPNPFFFHFQLFLMRLFVADGTSSFVLGIYVMHPIRYAGKGLALQLSGLWSVPTSTMNAVGSMVQERQVGRLAGESKSP